ncbi:MAG: biotin carboxyl carrier protein [Armatimonadetes bacterium]|jgi:pyruvate carboxylase subunit B|nr:biotin carboxyl carrier protein [Armatimonadota bacterium]
MRYLVTVAGREIEVEVDGDQVAVAGVVRTATLRPISGTPSRQLLVDGRPTVLSLRSTGRGQWTLAVAGDRWDTEVVDERTRHIRSLTAGSTVGRGPTTLRAPMPGLVVRVLVEVGQEVAAGTGVVVLEAMKMENELKAPASGVVGAVKVGPGEPVEKGQVLVELRDRATSP